MKSALVELIVRIEMEMRVNKFLRDSKDKETKISDLFCNNHVCSTINWIRVNNNTYKPKIEKKWILRDKTNNINKFLLFNTPLWQ